MPRADSREGKSVHPPNWPKAEKNSSSISSIKEGIRQAFRDEIPDTTKFIIAQRVASVEDADMIIVLDGGSINAIGTHQELLNSNDIYREVYMSQMKGGTEDA